MSGEPVRHEPAPRAVPPGGSPQEPTGAAPRSSVQRDAAPPAARRQPSVLLRLCAIVLIMEMIVIWLSIPVALAVDHASPRRAGVAGVVLAVAAVALAALARRRPRWTLVGGSMLQLLVIAAGAVVPVMYFLGAIFAALWVIGIGLGRRLDAAS
jgi:hypothetical protein